MSDALLDKTLQHLRALVGFDSRNPPRAIGTDGMFAYLAEQLQGFDIEVTDHGAGAVSLLAVRGAPTTLFNVHMDTVPASDDWSTSPFVLRIEDDRAIGLGACDIKGAAAALLAVAQAGQGDLALLFTSDEEANDAHGVAAYLARHGRRFENIVVAEPTGCRAVLAHRGISSVRMAFHAVSGHASRADALQASAVHQALRWGVAALQIAEAQAEQRFDTLQGLRMNIGRIEGGIKANMIAPHCELRFGFRPLPSQDMEAMHRGFAALAPQADYEETFRGPCLPAMSGDADAKLTAARELAKKLGLTVGDAVDFWTEASLFSAAGLTALVFGPGDIAQAHAPDEWVSLEQLRAYARTLHRAVNAVEENA